MRILVDGRLILTNLTGISRYLLGLLEHIHNIAKDDSFELFIQNNLPITHKVRQLKSERFYITELSLRHMDVRAAWTIPFKVWRLKPDIYHYPHFDLPWLVPGKVVATIHDLKYIRMPNLFHQESKKKQILIWLMTTFTCRRANQIITVSEYSKNDIVRTTRVHPEKVHVIYHGVDMRFYNQNNEFLLKKIRDRYQLPDKYILFIGERRPHKNLEGLIRAFVIFQKMCEPKYQLIIGGQQYPDYKNPEQLATSLDLSNSIRFIENIADEDLPSVYRMADAFVSISLYEGFGLPVLEAMASGTPVIASNLTALPEIVGQAGILVSPNDAQQVAQALTQVIPGGEKRNEYINLGIERARQFTWEKCAQQTYAVYKKTLVQ